MFSRHGTNGPKSKTTRMFRPVRQMAAPVGRQTTLFGQLRHGNGTGGEVYRTQLHLVLIFTVTEL